MRKWMTALAAVLTTSLLAGCATVHGPTSITLSRDDIERSIATDLGNLIEIFRGLDVRRPEVAFLPVAGRLELTWYLTMPAEGDGGLFGSTVGVAVAMTGQPALNAARTGIDLTDVKLDDVRVLGLPRLLGFGIGRLAERKGAPLPDVPLLSFRPAQMRVADVAYGATAVAVTFGGLRVDIEPR